MQGRNKPSVGLTCTEKLPRVNWPNHADAIQSSSSKDDFLSSSFWFSLPTQRPNPEANSETMLSLRYAAIYINQIDYRLYQASNKPLFLFFRYSACKIQGPERLQVPWIEKVCL
jgi:bloom syndrome protein